VPHVLVVLHDVTVTGASHAVLKPLEDLEARGWTFSFWAARPSELYDDLAARGLAVDGAPRMLRYSLRTLRHPPGLRARLGTLPKSLRAFRSHLRATQPALVHANTLHCLQEAFVARRTGLPVLVHSHEIPPAGAKGQVARAMTWMSADEVIAPSRASAEALRRGKRVPDVVHEPAVIPKTLPERVPRGDGEPLVVGSIGIVSHRKGSDLFVDAAERVLRRREDVEFRLVGAIEDSPEAAWAHALVDRARAAGIDYRERVDVARELPGWDVVVMPSRLDPFPLVVLEAMGHGLPVVATAVDGIPEQLAGETGVLVAPEDPAALATAIEGLLDDPARREALGVRARERVAGNFTVAHTAEGLDAAYRRTIEAATRR
jgi:glycosyltransferase involved in cell wall biosynthesis